MNSRLELSGKVCVLTGAAGLLGREFSDELVSKGADLVMVDRSRGPCESVAANLRDRYGGSKVIAFAADVSRQDEVQHLRDFVVQTFSRIDGLVNNAAIDDKFEDGAEALKESRFESYSLSRWQRMMDVNVTGAFLCCQALGSLMAERGSGSIVNVASTYGLVAPQQDLYRTPEGSQAFFKGAAYPTTKAALIGLTKYLASYWGPRRVRVNTLCPGGVENGQSQFFVNEYQRRTPLGRMAQASDYRAGLAFLLGDGSSYMTGSNLVIDGGWTAC